MKYGRDYREGSDAPGRDEALEWSLAPAVIATIWQRETQMLT